MIIKKIILALSSRQLSFKIGRIRFPRKIRIKNKYVDLKDLRNKAIKGIVGPQTKIYEYLQSRASEIGSVHLEYPIHIDHSVWDKICERHGITKSSGEDDLRHYKKSYLRLDIYAASLRMSFEYDGQGYHKNKTYDRIRDEYLLEALGIKTVRFNKTIDWKKELGMMSIKRYDIPFYPMDFSYSEYFIYYNGQETVDKLTEILARPENNNWISGKIILKTSDNLPIPLLRDTLGFKRVEIK